MKCKTIKDKSCSIEIWGKLGRPQIFGNILFGVSNFGEYNEYAGIYQRRYTKALQRKGKQIVKMRFYSPINPKTVKQLDQQLKMLVSSEYRKTLILQGKNDLIKSLTTREKRGIDIFTSQILKYRPANFGIILFGDEFRNKYLIN